LLYPLVVAAPLLGAGDRHEAPVFGALPDLAGGVPLLRDGARELEVLVREAQHEVYLHAATVVVDEILVVLLAQAVVSEEGEGDRVEDGRLADAVGPLEHPEAVVVEAELLRLAVAHEPAQADAHGDHCATSFVAARRPFRRRTTSSRSRWPRSRSSTKD